MIFDTHCHYNLEPLYENWPAHWQAAQEKGVVGSIIVGTSPESCQRALHIAEQESRFRVALGVHPNEYDQDRSLPDDIELLRYLAQKSGAVVAIGETGLDYFRLPDDASASELIKTRQQAAFTAHLQLATELQLPVIIHARDKGEEAYWDILKILKKTAFSQPFILHCVSGPLPYIEAAVALGAYLGVAGNVSYKTADHLRGLVRLAPANRLLLETDAPFLPPQPHRGKTCEPWMIRETAEFLQNEMDLPAAVLLQNTHHLFAI